MLLNVLLHGIVNVNRKCWLNLTQAWDAIESMVWAWIPGSEIKGCLKLCWKLPIHWEAAQAESATYFRNNYYYFIRSSSHVFYEQSIVTNKQIHWKSRFIILKIIIFVIVTNIIEKVLHVYYYLMASLLMLFFSCLVLSVQVKYFLVKMTKLLSWYWQIILLY